MISRQWCLTALAVALAGCNPNPGDPPKPTPKAAHTHPTKGPHGGPLVEWGEEEYHVEFTRDRAAQVATVYVLDGEVKKAVPIAARQVKLVLKQPVVEIELMAAPQEGDPPGQASRFTGKHAELAAEGRLAGTVSGETGGTPYSGDFKER